MVKMVMKWGIHGKRDDVGNMLDFKFMMGTDNVGNLYAKHLEGCDGNMSLVSRDFGKKTFKFICPKFSLFDLWSILMIGV